MCSCSVVLLFSFVCSVVSFLLVLFSFVVSSVFVFVLFCRDVFCFVCLYVFCVGCSVVLLFCLCSCLFVLFVCSSLFFVPVVLFDLWSTSALSHTRRLTHEHTQTVNRSYSVALDDIVLGSVAKVCSCVCVHACVFLFCC